MTQNKTHRQLSRRQFIRGSTALTAGLFFTPSLVQAAIGTGGNILEAGEFVTASHWGVVKARVEGGRFVSVNPHASDVYPCAMSEALPDFTNSPTRIKYPMVRKGFLENGHNSDRSERGKGEFVRVSWDEALDLVAKEITRVKDTHGNGSIFAGAYGWKTPGLLHNARSCLHRMLNLNGGFLDDVGSYSNGAISVIMPYVIGGSYWTSTPWTVTIEHSDLLVFWGSDPAVTCKIDYVAPDHAGFKHLQDLKKSGKRTIVIDPVRNRTAEYLGSEMISPRPGTDVAMMLGMAHTLLTEELHDKEFLSEYTVGFDKFSEYLLGKTDNIPKTAEWAAEICDVDADILRELARTMAKNKTFITMGWSIQRQHHGEQGPWMCFTLACMLGGIGLPGRGVDFTYHFASAGTPKPNAPKFSGLPTGATAEGMPAPIPVARVPWCMSNAGKPYDYNGKSYVAPDIRMVYWVGGNPLHHHQDRNQHIKHWQQPETIIVNEINWTATARFADIVLPVTSSAERNDITPVGRYGSGLSAMRQLVEPLHEAKSDYEIFREISKRLGFEDAYTEGRDEMAWLRHIYDAGRTKAEKKGIVIPDFDTFWNENPMLQFEVTKEAENFVNFADFREDPLLNPVATPSGKFEIFSRQIEKYQYADCPAHPTWMEPVERLGGAMSDKYPLHVSSAHSDDRLHSQLNNTWLRNKYEVNGREPVWINTEDAKARGIESGDVVRLFNDRGQTLAGAIVTDIIRPGVLRLSEGSWYDPLEPGVPGTLCKHGDVNTLTVDLGSSKLAQATSADTVLAEIEKFEGRIPPITVFTAPEPVKTKA